MPPKGTLKPTDRDEGGQGSPAPLPTYAKGVNFPTEVAYFVATEDDPGDKSEGRLKLKKGALLAVFRAQDPVWWLAKMGDDVGWVRSTSTGPIDSASGREPPNMPPSDTEWEVKKNGFMMASQMDVAAGFDMSVEQTKTFDHDGSKVTVFFVQVSALRKESNKGEIWVVAKTLKAFNRLRVAWEEDFGVNAVPTEPPPSRWKDVTADEWDAVRCACLKSFLEEVKHRPQLRNSQDLLHFLTTFSIDLSGGIVSSSLMKPFLDSWVKTSSEPTWTQALPAMPGSKKDAQGKGPQPSGVGTDANALKQAIPGLKPGDESFGVLRSRRPKMRRSDTFAQISSLAAVIKQEGGLDFGRRGWMEDGLKLNLLTQGGRTSSLRRRHERSVYEKYYDDGESTAINNRGSFNQMKFETRSNLEKIMYGHMDNLSKEGTVKYAAYASNLKKEEKDAKGEQGGVSGAPVKAADRFRRSSVTGKTHVKKNTMFVLDALASRLDKLNKVNEIQSTSGRNQEMGYEVCQYMSNVRGRFTMPMPVQLMALEEMTDEVLDRWVQVKWPAMGAANTFNRLREIETFLDRKRLRVNQVLRIVQEGRSDEEKLLLAILGCARLFDAVEAQELELWPKLEATLDELNLQRCKLVVQILAAEAQAEEASRASRKAAREVHADVQRARKALAFMTKAVTKIRSGTIQTQKFEQLKERLDALADSAHEEYRDAVKDAKPANEFAEEAIRWMETCERLYEDLDELGTALHERVKAVQNVDESAMSEKDRQKWQAVSIIQENLEVTQQMASNAFDLASRAADNARFDMQTALEEVGKADKIIKRVELEERRARNECDAAEGRIADEELPDDCPFATWSAEMREMMQSNMTKFIKDGGYRQQLDPSQCKGVEDILMMQVLLAKVQIIRDLRELKRAKLEAESKSEHEKNVKASKVKKAAKKDKKAKADADLDEEDVGDESDAADAASDSGSSSNEGGSSAGSSSSDESEGEVGHGKKRVDLAASAASPVSGLRRNQEMRRSLIGERLGKGKKVIGAKSAAEKVLPVTPGPAMRAGIQAPFTEEEEVC